MEIMDRIFTSLFAAFVSLTVFVTSVALAIAEPAVPPGAGIGTEPTKNGYCCFDLRDRTASGKRLAEKKAAVPGRVGVDDAEDCVAKPFVEAESLKAEGVEPGAGAAAVDCFFFGLPHEFAAEAGPAQGFW